MHTRCGKYSSNVDFFSFLLIKKSRELTARGRCNMAVSFSLSAEDSDL